MYLLTLKLQSTVVAFSTAADHNNSMPNEKEEFLKGEKVTFPTAETIVLENEGSVEIVQGRALHGQEYLNRGTHEFPKNASIFIYPNTIAQLSVSKV
jgi:hypothetical protein